jgi:biopolymer transport protein ExbD
LAGELSRKNDRTVIITATKGVRHGMVVTALDMSKQAGPKNFFGEKGQKMKKVREQGGAFRASTSPPSLILPWSLLIIMLVAAPVLNIPNMNVELPEAYTSETKQQNVSVSLGTDLRVAIDENIVPIDESPPVVGRDIKKETLRHGDHSRRQRRGL